MDAETGEVLSAFHTGPDPLALTVASGHVWTLNFGDGSLTRIDPATAGTTTIGSGDAVGIASDGHDLWVARTGNAIARLDGASGREEVMLRLADRALFAPRNAGFLAVGAGSLWLTVPAGDGAPRHQLWKIAPDSGEVLARIDIGADPTPPFVVGRHAWVVSTAEQSLVRVDADTNEVTPVPVESFPWSLASGGGSLWIGHHGSPVVRRFDPRTFDVSAEIDFETNPRGLAFSAGLLWVATEDGLHAVDPSINRVVRSTSFGPFTADTGPIGVAVSEASVWVSIE